MQLFAGIIDPETLSAVEQNPQGELAKSAALCTALEIRYDLFLDCGASEEDLVALSKRVRSLYPKAFQIGTIRLKRDGGMFPDARSQDRARYFNAILSTGDRPNVVDIEIEELGTLLPKVQAALKSTGTKFLVSHHDFLKVPTVAEFQVWIEQAKAAGANGYKTACMSTAEGDFDCIYPLIEQESKNFELFSLFAMGASGQESRVKSLLFGANITYCSIGKAVAPGQLSVEDALNQYKMLAKNR
ncbi:MAG: type I 3-dehydroquinate dehydratase [Fibrobacter sp.]|nr:type I 3-dehydroquinate dehydratase [Fibrobacter sp.]